MHFSEVKKPTNVGNLQQPIRENRLDASERRPSLHDDYASMLERELEALEAVTFIDSKRNSLLGRLICWLTSIKTPMFAPKRDLDIHEWRRLEYRQMKPKRVTLEAPHWLEMSDHSGPDPVSRACSEKYGNLRWHI